MVFRLVDTRRAAELLRRHGAGAALAALVIVGLAALAALGATDRRGDAARTARRDTAAALHLAGAVLDRDQRMLDRLAVLGAAGADAPAQTFLDQVATLAPGTFGAGLYDADGMLLLRSPGDSAVPALGALGTVAAGTAASEGDAALFVTRPVGAGPNVLIGLAQGWRAPDGRIGGIALVALDRTAFGGIDLARSDGSPLFAGAAAAEPMATVAVPGYPLQLRYPLPAARRFDALRGDWPFVAIAVIGVTAMLSLVALLTARLHGAEREAARLAALENELRGKLVAQSAAASRNDELSRGKSRFFAQVTHELRTPLNAILGFSETIRQEMFGPVGSPKYREYAGLIHDAGGHLLSLINDLLDNARIEAGKMEIVPIRMAATALARSALDLVELLAAARKIELSTKGLANIPDLKVDPRAMKQVLLNLLSNAIKYTPQGGRIDLRFTARDNGSVAIEIADTGIGMSAEDLRIAFEPFGRAGAGNAQRQPGTGLGLSLTRALVRLHGGELTLWSRPGSGTVATVVLPPGAVCAGDAPQQPAPEEKPEGQPAGSVRAA